MEFKEAMKTINRICKMHPRCYEDYAECPLGKANCCGITTFYCDEPLRTEKIEKIEKIVEEWARNNPEPVYPTWEEWLKTIGILTGDVKMSAAFPGFMYRVNDSIFEQIPEEIGKKLGIEPKKG